MSKLVSAVYAKQTGIRLPRPQPTPLNMLTVQESWSPSYPCDAEFRVGVELSQTMRVSEEMVGNRGDALTTVTRVVKDAIIEEVFGEFRPHLRAIQLAIYNHDWETANTALQALEHQMFSSENTEGK